MTAGAQRIFTEMAKRGDFLESAEVYGNVYGTSQSWISQEIAKQITKLIRDEFKKVQASIQGDAVRVSSKTKDDLQTVIQRLKEEEFPVALQFTNYR